MGIPFVGIIFSLGTGIILIIFEEMKIKIFHEGSELKLPSKRFIKTLLIIFLIVSGNFIAFKGVKTSLYRKTQDIFENSLFKGEFSTEELRILKWGEPASIKGCEVKVQEIEDLIEFLKRNEKNFFIFPDFTIFYGLLNFPSPQPILWFHEGLTYPSTYEKSLDQWIVNDLKKNKVEIIVIEECSWFGTEERLRNFPLLRSYIEQNFKRAHQIGIFSIHKSVSFQLNIATK